MILSEVRETVLKAALEMSRLGLIRGTSGNISARDSATGYVAITPTSLPYETLKTEDIPVVTVSGEVVEGKHKSSSETPMHTAIYRARPDVMAVIHTHSVYATVFSVLNRPLPVVTVPLVFAGGPVPVAPFALPGSNELADVAVKALGKGSSVLLQNHGVICVAPDMKKAMAAAIYVEEGAQVGFLALSAGGLNPIPEAYVEKMRLAVSKGAAL
ncbi:MAG: class II aldolase/adducin family protein [Firmicutes bacterium]|nr:class II aldolase/adducin family protein [Bacillota bacterium]